MTKQDMVEAYMRMGLSKAEAAIAVGVEHSIVNGGEPESALEEGFRALGLNAQEAKIAATGKPLQESKQLTYRLYEKPGGDEYFADSTGKVVDAAVAFPVWNRESGSKLKSFLTDDGRKILPDGTVVRLKY